MLIESPDDGMTVEVWVNYIQFKPGFLATLTRKAVDWRKDDGGLTEANFEVIEKYEAARGRNEELRCRALAEMVVPNEVHHSSPEHPIHSREPLSNHTFLGRGAQA